MKAQFLTFFLLISLFGSAQKDKGDFLLGDFSDISYPSELSIRTDTFMNRIIQACGGIGPIVLEGPPQYVSKGDYWSFGQIGELHFDASGTIEKQFNDKIYGNNVVINSEYWDSKHFDPSVILLGRLNFHSRKLKKVEWLQCYPELGGLIDLDKLKNLKSLVISSRGLSIPFSSHYEGHRHRLINRGFSFLNRRLEELTSLEYLQLDRYSKVGSNNLYGYDRSGFLLLTGLSSKVFALPNLKSLKLSGLTYLPTNYMDFGKFDNLSFHQIYQPELVNLALVMNAFGKDSNKGDWKKYLDQGDVKRELEIPDTGPYEAYYKSGQILCKGEFYDRSPHGTWYFWYESGAICQKREYRHGEKSGEWVFYANAQEGRIRKNTDTTHYFIFSDDRLIKRLDCQRDDFPPGPSSCYDYHANQISSFSILKDEYKFDWKEESVLTIVRSFRSLKTTQNGNTFEYTGDTLGGMNELWYNDNQRWEYRYSNFENLCPGNHEIVDHYSRGRPNYMLDYSEDKVFYGLSRAVSVLDFEKLRISYQFLSRADENSEFQLIESFNKEITNYILPLPKLK